MAINLFVSYDLDAPGQNYKAVEAAIEGLGPSIRVLQSVFYVQTNFSLEAASQKMLAAVDNNDRFVVVEAANAMFWNLQNDGDKVIPQHWAR